MVGGHPGAAPFGDVEPFGQRFDVLAGDAQLGVEPEVAALDEAVGTADGKRPSRIRFSAVGTRLRTLWGP